MRPADQRRATLRKAAAKGGRAQPGKSKRDAALVKGVFAQVHGEDCEEYALICAAVDLHIGEPDIMGLLMAEYVEFRAVQEAGGIMSASTAITLRLKILEQMRKIAAVQVERDELPSTIDIRVKHVAAEERATNRGPGVEVK